MAEENRLRIINRTPEQQDVSHERSRELIATARHMGIDANTFWALAEAMYVVAVESKRKGNFKFAHLLDALKMIRLDYKSACHLPGYTENQMLILQVLSEHEEAINLALVAHEAGIHRATVNSAILILLNKGDVVRCRMLGHTGYFLLTEKGARIAAELPDEIDADSLLRA
jgi:DNA-binding MarR family transcriptional regulator